MIFSIVFKNESNHEFILKFETYDTEIANKWADCLLEQYNKDPCIKEKDRFYNFPLDDWTEERLVNELNECIEIINQNENVINHTAYIGMPQEQLNHLHHYFEKLRGGILTPTEFWLNSNEQIRDALDKYNVIIHRAENFYSSHNNNYTPRIVCTFNHRKRYLLEDKDYKYFTLERKFGEVYINYCEVGKPLYDVFKDGDDVVGEDNIRPLRYYSPDMTVSFHPRSKNNVDKFLTDMDIWWDQNNNYLTALGFSKNDPKNAIGNIPVAKIISDKELSFENCVDIVLNVVAHPIMDRIEIDV